MAKATSAQVRKIVRAHLGGVLYSDKTKYGRRMSWYPHRYGRPEHNTNNLPIEAAIKQVDKQLAGLKADNITFGMDRRGDRFRYGPPMYRVSVVEK